MILEKNFKMLFSTFLLSFLLFLCSGLNTTGRTLSSYNSVIELTESSIDETINRPETKLWLVVFYAPWCKYSQEFFPVLDDVAPTLKGQLIIGKVDCSIDLSLCSEEQHDIRFYPTLKWYRDGSFHNYDHSGRSHDDIISFARKMNGPVMKRVQDYREILDTEIPNDSILSNSAIFVFYSLNPVVQQSVSDRHENESRSLMSFNNDRNHDINKGMSALLKVAREYQSTNSFVHLESNEKNQEWIKKFLSYPSSSLSSERILTYDEVNSRNILMKLERDTRPTILYSDWTFHSLSKYIQQNSETIVPFVTDETVQYYGSRNMKKYLAIAIVDSSNIIGIGSENSG